MPLSTTFKRELAEIDELIATLQGRLRQLEDYAEFDGLPVEVVRRLGNKRRAIAVVREDLRGIPPMAAAAEARR